MDERVVRNMVILSGIFGASIVVANLLAGVKLEFFFSSTLFGIPLDAIVPAGTIAYAVTFPITDIVDEVYGKRPALWVVWAGLAAEVVMLGLVLVDYTIPALEPNMQELYKTAFMMQPRIVVASITAYLVSQHHDVWAFLKIKEATQGRYLWLRNNLSTMVSQFLDTVVFTVVAFGGLFSFWIIISMIISTWLVKLIVAAIDTPFVYAGVKLIKGA